MTKVLTVSVRITGKGPEEYVGFKYRTWRLGERCVAHNAGVCLSCLSPAECLRDVIFVMTKFQRLIGHRVDNVRGGDFDAPGLSDRCVIRFPGTGLSCTSPRSFIVLRHD